MRRNIREQVSKLSYTCVFLSSPTQRDPQFSYDQSKESREFATNWTNTFPFLAPKSVEEHSLPIFIFHQFSNHLSNLFFVFLHNPSLPFASILFTLHLPLFTFPPRLASLKFPSGLLLATLPLFFFISRYFLSLSPPSTTIFRFFFFAWFSSEFCLGVGFFALFVFLHFWPVGYGLIRDFDAETRRKSSIETNRLKGLHSERILLCGDV